MHHSEGSGAAATPRKIEIKLANVTRASLNDEPIKDCKSFLIQRGLRVWHSDSSDLVPACPTCSAQCACAVQAKAPRAFIPVRSVQG
jgi:hypothetical protein